VVIQYKNKHAHSKRLFSDDNSDEKGCSTTPSPPSFSTDNNEDGPFRLRSKRDSAFFFLRQGWERDTAGVLWRVSVLSVESTKFVVLVRY